jgi:hypothetical protein
VPPARPLNVHQRPKALLIACGMVMSNAPWYEVLSPGYDDYAPFLRCVRL